jgi:hypothetical protein
LIVAAIPGSIATTEIAAIGTLPELNPTSHWVAQASERIGHALDATSPHKVSFL